MINKALQFTRDVLDQFIRNRYGIEENKVILNTLIEANGNIPQVNQNKVVMSLINIEKETLKPFYNKTSQRIAGANYAELNPSERYNLDLLISSSFDDYGETLKFLNTVILFFQINPMIDASAYSTIPAGLHKLEYEIEKIGYHQMHSLWTAMGAKYQPSVIYKVRLITIQGNEAASFTPGVTQVSTSAAS
jgi:hypothetical protein